MLARYGRRVWKIDDTDDAGVADLVITKTEEFMRQMGCPVAHLEQARHTALGENADICPNDVRTILRLAA